MPFIAPEDMKTSERLPGWQGRFWRSESMSFAHYEIAASAAIHTLSEARALIANHPVRHEFL